MAGSACKHGSKLTLSPSAAQSGELHHLSDEDLLGAVHHMEVVAGSVLRASLHLLHKRKKSLAAKAGGEAAR